MWPGHVIVLFDEFSEQPLKMSLTKHYHVIEHLSS